MESRWIEQLESRQLLAGATGWEAGGLSDSGDQAIIVSQKRVRDRRVATVPAEFAQARLKGAPDYSNDAISGTSARGFRTVTYEIKITNTTDSADQFFVRANLKDPHFIDNFYNSTATGFGGGVIVTSQVSGAGWKTPEIAPGGTLEFRVDAAPLLAARGGDVNQLVVLISPALDSTHQDMVQLNTTTPVTAIPEIRRRNFDDGGVYLASVANQGNVKDQFQLTAPAGGDGWKARYFDAEHGGHDITAAITGAGWDTPILAPKAEQKFRVEIQRSVGVVRSLTVTAKSLADNSKSDFAKFSTQKPIAGPKVFVIGVWSQPTYNFDKWKRRGINTLMNYEGLSGTVSLDQWINAANARGLYQIREWRDDPAQDKNEKLLLAWTGGDEPDIYSSSRQALAGDYQMLKSVDPNRPVIINFAGSNVVDWGQFPLKRSDFESMLPSMDWVSEGVYPVTGWDRPEHLDAPGRAVDRLQKYSDGKPQFSIIESGDQQLPWMPKQLRSATRDEFRAQLWDSVIRGAQGILYFPDAFMPRFVFDNTSADIDKEMTVQNKRLADIGKILLTSADPPKVGLNLSGSLEGTWRVVGRKKYFVVLNMSDKALKGAKLATWGVGKTAKVKVVSEKRVLKMQKGALKDNFGPYQAHVYQIG